MICLSDKEISVVVQGPVVGNQSAPTLERLTLSCLQSVRKHLPSAQIIFSTWDGADTSGLPYDELVKSPDPGGLVYFDPPQKHLHNVNRQIVTTLAGLEMASRPFALKFRSDLELRGAGFLRFWNRYPDRSENWKVVRDRVVCGTLYSRNPKRFYAFPFHPSDWFHYGRTEDLRSIWDLPLMRAADVNTYTPEQYIWISFLRKFGGIDFKVWDRSSAAIHLTELTFANNLVIIDPSQSDIFLSKYADLRWTDWASVYSHNEWEKLYHKHCVGTSFINWRVEDKVRLAVDFFIRSWRRVNWLRSRISGLN